MQTKQELEDWYTDKDPWSYETTEDDVRRKRRIQQILSVYKKFDRALDIGCGEGFITRSLPAKTIHGIELSDKAASRLPDNIKRVYEPDGKYDLIICTGMMYQQYDYKQFAKWINEHASNIVLLCNIESWEIEVLPADKLIYDEEFPYRQYKQKLRVYKYDSVS